MKQIKTYTKSDFHNPEQLTRQQVGDEYRLLLNDELPYAQNYGEGIQLILDDYWVIANGDSITIIYRVPIATPLPDGTVLSSNECCFSDAPAKPRIYCAGAMSSHPDDFNFPAFFKASGELEKQGYEAVNPAQLDIDAGYTLEKLKQLSPAEFQEFLKGAVKRDLDAIQTCQAIAMLPGWESSKGAKAELALAQWLGLDEVYMEDAKTPYESKEPDADGWIPHIPGDPMPCDGGSIVDIIDRDGGKYFSFSADQTDIYWSKYYHNPIVKWRPAQPKQPYNSDERAEWGSDCGKIDIGDYCISREESERYTIKLAPGNSGYVDRDSRGCVTGSGYAPDDPKGAAGAKKAPMWLLPASAMRETAWVHKHGADKYGPFNWREGSVCSSTYISAIMRHLDQWRDGEDNDTESGYSHIAHIAASCNILMDAQHCGKLRDDRNKA